MDENGSEVRMTSRKIAFFCLVGLLATFGCGGGTTRSSSPPPPPPTPPPPPIVLRTLYRVLASETDRMTTFGPYERSAYPLEAQVYYVPDADASDRTVLNRMVNAGDVDHADATGPLNGYSVDEALGSPWSASTVPGLTPLLEGFNQSTGDHAMLIPSENLPGYVPQPLAAYGYPRYGNQGEVLLDLTAGGVTVESNAVAGGATWRWTWNGVQFLNNADYGRQIQCDFNFPSNSGNPTEAGDYYDRTNPITAHGSPLLRFEDQGNTQYTRAVPLNWDPTAFGGDPDHPIIWNQMVLGKDLTLNFNNLGSVAKYSTHLTLPTPTRGTFEAPAVYLRANFNRFWTYDAPSGALAEITDQVPSGCNFAGSYFYSPHFGGAIVSDATGQYALGVYGVDDANGGSVTFFNISNFICSGDGSGESAGDTVAVSAFKGRIDELFLFPAGDSTYDVYIITDTLENVAAQMAHLYTMGVK